MKKTVLALAVAAMCAFSFTACDEDLDLVGHITLTASNPQAGIPGLTQPYVDGTSLNFKSAMCNVHVDSIIVEDAGEYSGTYYDVNAGTVFVGTTQTLVSNNIADLTFPLCGINLRDTTIGTYTISMPINDFSFIDYLDTTDVNSIISTGLTISENIGNVFAVAVTDSAYYIGYEGSISLTAYGSEFHRVEGTVNNVKAIYVTLEQLEYLANLPAAQRNNFDLAGYLPKITFNGDITCMRADMEAVMDALEAQSNNRNN